MSVKIDTDELLDLAKLMMPGAQDNAMVRAINRVGEEARRLSQDTMTRDYTFRLGDAMVALERATRGRLYAILKASGKRKSLMYFNAQEVAKGVSAQIQMGKKTKRQRAFIARPKGKNWKKFGQSKMIAMPDLMVLQRVEKSKVKYSGYPLRKIVGPSVGVILKSKKNIENINSIIRRLGESIFTEEVEKIFNGRR